MSLRIPDDHRPLGTPLPAPAPARPASPRPDEGAPVADRTDLSPLGRARALAVQRENRMAAESHVADVERAEQAVRELRAQILDDPRSALAAQAGQDPHAVLRLLGGSRP
jgi:hypothetical protein